MPGGQSPAPQSPPVPPPPVPPPPVPRQPAADRLPVTPDSVAAPDPTAIPGPTAAPGPTTPPVFPGSAPVPGEVAAPDSDEPAFDPDWEPTWTAEEEGGEPDGDEPAAPTEASAAARGPESLPADAVRPTGDRRGAGGPDGGTAPRPPAAPTPPPAQEPEWAPPTAAADPRSAVPRPGPPTAETPAVPLLPLHRRQERRGVDAGSAPGGRRQEPHRADAPTTTTWQDPPRAPEAEDVVAGRPDRRERVGADAAALSPWDDEQPPAASPSSGSADRDARRKAPLLIGGTFGVLVLIVLIVIGVMALTGGHAHKHVAGPPKPTPKPSPTQTHSINSASTDPGPLVLGQFFPPSVDLAGRDYTLLGSETSACSITVPAAYQSVMTKQDCTEVLRATYESSTKKTIATVAVAVFGSADNAQAVSDTMHQEGSVDKANWLLPMAEKQAPKFTAKSPVACQVKPVGRYLLMWAGGYVDSRRLTSASSAVSQMLTDLFSQAEAPIRARMSPSDRAEQPDADQSTSVPVPSASGAPALDRSATPRH